MTGPKRPRPRVVGDDRAMPLHNLLRHAAGYVSRGCAACEWLLERGYITEGDCHE